MSLRTVTNGIKRTIVDRVLFPLGFRGRRAQSAFSRIYRSRAWFGSESASGPGSDLEWTEEIRHKLPQLFRELGVRTFLDAPCGDFNWMRHVDLSTVEYVGVDVVDELIADNRQKYESNGVRFVRADITKDALPPADLILCRDCLVHMPLKWDIAALRNFKRSGASYLLTTTFPHTTKNEDILMGHWRPMNMELTPFGFPPPLMLIDDRYLGPMGNYADKTLGLWRLTDVLPD